MAAATQTEKVPKGTKSSKLEDQAATAALYVTGAKKENKSNSQGLLDADGKLSSASAATSLKYAKPHELPSFPVVGINQDSSAGAAASLAAANQKPFEHWKPEQSQPANKAALLAHDLKSAPVWQPEASSAGSKAAYLAATGGTKVDIWRPDATAEGNSAAGLAMRGKSMAPNVDYGYTPDGRHKALLAATGAISGKHRPASTGTPEPLYPDAQNSAANALKAATKAHKPGTPQPTPVPNDLPGLSSADATRIHKAAVTNLDREMYTNNPPVAPEIEERNREAALRASAITMANKMYESAEKRRQNESALQAASNVHRQAAEEDHAEKIKKEAKNYLILQDTARKLADERLSKLTDENEEYRKHYGFASPPPKSRLSLRGRRQSQVEETVDSDSDSDDADRKRSARIRTQMSGLNKSVQDVDAKKRQKDRDTLLQAARRNVDKDMATMDERVFQETGKASPAMQAEWDSKARAKAEAESMARMSNHGKVAIGGGKYMDQSEIEAIAAGRVQPTIEQAHARADEKRAADEARRQAAEEEKRLKAEKAADDKERDEKTKAEWKRFKAEEKEEAKQKKDAEKARKAEEKAEEKRRREEQLKAINEQDIKRPSDRDSKRKSTLGSFASAFKSKRKSHTETSEGAVAVGEVTTESRRSSTSLESLEDDAGAAVAAHSTEFKERNKEAEPPAEIDTGAVAQTEVAGPSGVAIPSPKTETTVTGGRKEIEASKEKDKKESWFKRLSRRTSRKIKPEEIPIRTDKVDKKEGEKDNASKAEEPTADEGAGISPTGIPTLEITKNPYSNLKGAVARDEVSRDPRLPVPAIRPAEPLTSATINPAEDSAISPVEADAVAARAEFEEETKRANVPTPLHLAPTNDSTGLNNSERDVALAGKEDNTAVSPLPPRSRSTSLSSLSREGVQAEGSSADRGRAEAQNLKKVDTFSSGGEEFQEAQDTVNTADLPLPAFPKDPRGSMESPHRETRFREEL